MMTNLEDLQRAVKDLQTTLQNLGFVADHTFYKLPEKDIKILKDELDISKKREEIAIACLCRLREQGNEDAIQTLEELKQDEIYINKN